MTSSKRRCCRCVSMQCCRVTQPQIHECRLCSAHSKDFPGLMASSDWCCTAQCAPHPLCTASPAYLMVHFSLISSHCTSSPGYLTLNISLLTSHSSLQPLHISLCASHCAHLTVLITSRCLSHSATPSTDILYTSHSHMQVACLCCPSLTRCSTQAVCDGS